MSEGNLAKREGNLLAWSFMRFDLPRIATSVVQQKDQGITRGSANANLWKYWAVADRAGELQLATRM